MNSVDFISSTLSLSYEAKGFGHPSETLRVQLGKLDLQCFYVF